MPLYHFITNWFFQAPIERVWEELIHVADWPSWWASWKRVVIHGSASEVQVGSMVEHEVRGSVLYTLRFRTVVTALEPPKLLTIASSGDLVGVGTFVLEPFNDGTAVTYRWDVRLSNPVLDFLGRLPFARTLMECNHDTVMEEGYRGLKKRLEGKGDDSSAPGIR
ncbi:MAG: SRPBCC family protein [Nitrospira sp.]|nr:SRPBCC family protein [Nitrospira sp.]MCP9465082.1 SRPBCC family protein [Nitrospira sp.]